MTSPSRISREGDDALVGPEHRHDGIEGTCTARHLVEPIDERTSVYLRGLSIEQIVSQHEHGEGLLKESEIALDLMKRLRVFCDQRGFHTHGMATDRTADRTFNSSPMAHHHHDLRCLVEAGANQIRPELDKVGRKLTDTKSRLSSARQTIARYGAEIDRQTRVLESTRASLKAIQAEQDQMRRFMASMPAVGPWGTLSDQYDSWCEEQAEEADEASAETNPRDNEHG